MILAILAITYSIIVTFSIVNVTFDPYELGVNWSNKVCVLLYFTNDSNIFVGLYLLLFGIGTLSKCDKLTSFLRKKTIMVCIEVYIFLTFVIVALLLAPIYKGDWIYNGIDGIGAVCFTHGFTPLIFFIFFLFIKSDGKYDWKRNFYTLVYPVLWFFPIILPLGLTKTVYFKNPESAGGNGQYQYFPYLFLDPGKQGMCKGNPYIYTVILLALCLIIYGVGMLISLIKSKTENKIAY